MSDPDENTIKHLRILDEDIRTTERLLHSMKQLRWSHLQPMSEHDRRMHGTYAKAVLRLIVEGHL